MNVNLASFPTLLTDSRSSSMSLVVGAPDERQFKLSLSYTWNGLMKFVMALITFPVDSTLCDNLQKSDIFV